MKTSAKILKLILPSMVVLAASRAANACACAACAGGQTDSAMAEGMNWGIMALLVVVGTVLSGITGFFVFIAKKNREV